MRLKRFKTIILANVLILTTLAFTACPKEKIVGWTDQAISSFAKARPFIAQFIPNALPKIDQGIAILGKFKTAYANSEDTALGYLEGGIAALEDIVMNDIPQIHDESTRALIMGALALADIALHLIAANIGKVSAKVTRGTPQASQATNRITAFSKKKAWGYAYEH